MNYFSYYLLECKVILWKCVGKFRVVSIRFVLLRFVSSCHKRHESILLDPFNLRDPGESRLFWFDTGSGSVSAVVFPPLIHSFMWSLGLYRYYERLSILRYFPPVCRRCSSIAILSTREDFLKLHVNHSCTIYHRDTCSTHCVWVHFGSKVFPLLIYYTAI